MDENMKLILDELAKINARLENLEAGQKNLETGQKNLEAGQKGINARLDGIDAKIDQHFTALSDAIAHSVEEIGAIYDPLKTTVREQGAVLRQLTYDQFVRKVI